MHLSLINLSFSIITIFFQWIGKTLWWSFMSSIPDVVGGEEDSLARMFSDDQDDSIIFNIAKTFLSNANELIFSRGLAESLGFNL